MSLFVALFSDDDWHHSKVYGIADTLDKAKIMVFNWLKEHYNRVGLNWDEYTILWDSMKSKNEYINCYSVDGFEKDGERWDLYYKYGVLRYEDIEIFEYELNKEYCAW